MLDKNFEGGRSNWIQNNQWWTWDFTLPRFSREFGTN